MIINNDKINEQITKLILKTYAKSKRTYEIERLYLYVKNNINTTVNCKKIYRIKPALGKRLSVKNFIIENITL